MIKEAFYSGVESAMTKLGFMIPSVGQTAANAVNKGFGVKFTKSLDNTKNLSPKVGNHGVGPTGRAGPSTTKAPVANSFIR